MQNTPEQARLYRCLVLACEQSPHQVYTFYMMRDAKRELCLDRGYDLLHALEELEQAGLITLNNPEAGEPTQFVPWHITIVKESEVQR